jgi:hypothetical protein
MLRQFGWGAALLYAIGLTGPATAAPAESAGDADQIRSLIAPIALYPDPLVAKVLIASTYPLEVIEAATWMQQNGGSADGAVGGTLRMQRWDASIKDLARVRRVIVAMNDHIDWTQMLGDSLLSRPAAILDAIQSLRAKALSSGFLASSDDETVHADHDGIELRPARTDVASLPYYDPNALLGKPSARLQALWPAPPGYRYQKKIAFLPGVLVPPTLWNAGIDWEERRIYFSRRLKPGNLGNPVRPPERIAWHHDPLHRRGVDYSTAELRARYGGAPAPDAQARRSFRGFSPASSGPSGSAGQTGLTDTGFDFAKHGGAIDGVGEGTEIDTFSRRGHRSLTGPPVSGKPRPADTLQP